jgi:hypothetical protein
MVAMVLMRALHKDIARYIAYIHIDTDTTKWTCKKTSKKIQDGNLFMAMYFVHHVIPSSSPSSLEMDPNYS